MGRKPKLALCRAKPEVRLPAKCRHPIRVTRKEYQMFLMALTLSAIEPPARPMDFELVRDAITDHLRAYAIQRDHRNRLVVSCEPENHDGPRVTFHSERWLARGQLLSGNRPVTYRFDQSPPQRVLWDINDRRGILSSQRRVRSFLEYLMVSETLVIRTRDSEDHPFDITFRLVDVRPAVEQVLATCAAYAAQES
jgi:hypothetical protein